MKTKNAKKLRSTTEAKLKPTSKKTRHHGSVNKRTRKNWTSEQARLALDDIADGVPVKTAAKKWSIPRTTLRDLKKGLYTPSSRPGPSPVLTDDEELLICEWITEMARRGIPLVLNNLLDSIQHIITTDARPNPFKDGRPGIAWFRAFLRRHPNIAQRNAESICRARGALTEGCIRGWFADALQFFTDSKIDYILNDCTRHYNGDETGFQLDPKTTKVLGPVSETIYTESGGNREQVTVLITTRGDGALCTSAIVYPYKRSIPKAIIEKIPPGFCAARSDSGWMTSDVFFEYMANNFIPELAHYRRQQKGIADDEELLLDETDWVVYWIDGYKSHLTIHTSKLCELNKIILYCFKAHASHVCQPNDVGPFKPLKQEWRLAVSKWRSDHPYEALTRVSFAGVLATALQQLNPAAVRAGYRATGLCPFNPEAVHYDRLTSTNSRKFDAQAFPQQSETRSFDEDCQVAVRCVEAILGPDITAVYNSLSSMQVISVEMLPPVNAYMVWKMLKLNSEHSSNLQQIIVTADMNMSTPEITLTHSNLNQPVQLSLEQIGPMSTLSKEDLDAVGIAAETSPVGQITTEELTGVDVDVEPSPEVTHQPDQQSTLSKEDVDDAGVAAETSPVGQITTEELTGVDVDIEPSPEVSHQPDQQSTLSKEGQMLVSTLFVSLSILFHCPHPTPILSWLLTVFTTIRGWHTSDPCMHIDYCCYHCRHDNNRPSDEY